VISVYPDYVPPAPTGGDVPPPTGDVPAPVPAPSGGGSVPTPSGDFPAPAPSDGGVSPEIPYYPPTGGDQPPPTGGAPVPTPGKRLMMLVDLVMVVDEQLRWLPLF
jgi:hypothetical protein